MNIIAFHQADHQKSWAPYFHFPCSPSQAWAPYVLLYHVTIQDMLFWGANESCSWLPSEPHVVELQLVLLFVVLAANFRAGTSFPKTIIHRD